MPIFLTYELCFDAVNFAPKEIDYRVIKELTLESFYRNFSVSSMHDVLGEPDVIRGATMLHEKLLTCYNESVSLKNKVTSVKDQLKPLITPANKSSIKRRNQFSSPYKQSRMSKHEYNYFRTRINIEIRNTKKNYYQKLFQNIKKYIKQTWIVINKVLNCKSKKQNLNTKSLILSNRLYTDVLGISQAFNDHFATTANNVREAVPVPDSAVRFTQYMGDFFQSSSFFIISKFC